MAKTVRYIALRSLVSSSPVHVAGTEYEQQITPTEIDRRRNFDKTVVTSINGREFATTRHTKQEWRIKLAPSGAARTEKMREFMDSTMSGEFFYLDLDDGEGDRPVVMKGNNYRERRAVKLGDGGDSDMYIFEFTCRER